MSALKLIPLKYHLETLMSHLHVTVEAVQFDKKGNPKKWAVYRGQTFRLSKVSGQFDYEPIPSSRDDEYIKEHSFNTPEAAAAYYERSMNARKDERQYYVSLKK